MLDWSRGKEDSISDICEDKCVAVDEDGGCSSSWRVETIPEEACVEGEVGGSSWPVAEDAPKYFRSAPELQLNLKLKDRMFMFYNS